MSQRLVPTAVGWHIVDELAVFEVTAPSISILSVKWRMRRFCRQPLLHWRAAGEEVMSETGPRLTVSFGSDAISGCVSSRLLDWSGSMNPVALSLEWACSSFIYNLPPALAICLLSCCTPKVYLLWGNGNTSIKAAFGIRQGLGKSLIGSVGYVSSCESIDPNSVCKVTN